MDRDRLYAHLAAGAVDAEGDFASVGDQNLFEQWDGPLFESHEYFAELDRLSILDENLADHPGLGSLDRVHHLHRFDDQNGLPGLHRIAHADERRPTRFGGNISGADHGGSESAGMA